MEQNQNSYQPNSLSEYFQYLFETYNKTNDIHTIIKIIKNLKQSFNVQFIDSFRLCHCFFPNKDLINIDKINDVNYLCNINFDDIDINTENDKYTIIYILIYIMIIVIDKNTIEYCSNLNEFIQIYNNIIKKSSKLNKGTQTSNTIIPISTSTSTSFNYNNNNNNSSYTNKNNEKFNTFKIKINTITEYIKNNFFIYPIKCSTKYCQKIQSILMNQKYQQYVKRGLIFKYWIPINNNKIINIIKIPLDNNNNSISLNPICIDNDDRIKSYANVNLDPYLTKIENMIRFKNYFEIDFLSRAIKNININSNSSQYIKNYGIYEKKYPKIIKILIQKNCNDLFINDLASYFNFMYCELYKYFNNKIPSNYDYMLNELISLIINSQYTKKKIYGNNNNNNNNIRNNNSLINKIKIYIENCKNGTNINSIYSNNFTNSPSVSQNNYKFKNNNFYNLQTKTQKRKLKNIFFNLKSGYARRSMTQMLFKSPSLIHSHRRENKMIKRRRKNNKKKIIN